MPVPTADNTFGAWFIGNQVSLVAFGFLLLQGWIFCQNWNREPLILRLVVLLALVLGFFLIFLTSHALFHYLISSMGNPQALDEIIWSFKAEPFASEAVVTLTHLFYTGRIFQVQRHVLLPGFLLLLTLSHTVLNLVASGLEISITGLVAAKDTSRLAQAGLSLDLTIDVIIMLAMFHFFYTNRTEIKSTQSLLNKLALYTFASGSLTVVANAVILATFITESNTQIYSGASFILPHLYSNCLLAVLNSRSHLRSRYNEESTGPKLKKESTELSTLHASDSIPVFEVNVSNRSDGSSTEVMENLSRGQYSFSEVSPKFGFGGIDADSGVPMTAQVPVPPVRKLSDRAFV